MRCQACLPDGVWGALDRLQCGCNFVFLLVQSALLDFYLKTILMSKTKPQKHVLVRYPTTELFVLLSYMQRPVLSALFPLQDSCSPLLRYMSHAEFKDLVLPTLQKSLLRSPENVIESESVISLRCSVKKHEQLFLRGLELLGECASLDYAFSPVSAGSRIVWRLRVGCGEATFVV